MNTNYKYHKRCVNFTKNPRCFVKRVPGQRSQVHAHSFSTVKVNWCVQIFYRFKFFFAQVRVLSGLVVSEDT